MRDTNLEQLCFQGEPEEANWIRGELLSWNPRDFWFYVYNDGTIYVANDFGGKLHTPELEKVKKHAMELSRIFRNKG